MNRLPWPIFWIVFFLVGCGPSPDQDPGKTATAFQPAETKPVRQVEDALTFDQGRTIGRLNNYRI